MKGRRGFSLLELMIALAISGIVISGAGFIMYQLFAENKSLETWSSGQHEISMSLRDLEAELRNVVRLDPVENTGRGYRGILSLRPSESPSRCATGADASVVRYTTLERRKKAERLLRAWSESLDANEIGAEHEFRVTTGTERETLFQNGNSPQEVIVVDADRRFIRRYEVASFTLRMNDNRDPYDDLPKTDSFGQPVLFDWARVLLRMGRSESGATVPKEGATMITGSEVYGARTYVVCLRASDGALIKWNQVTDEETVLMTNPTDEFTIRSFHVTYLATRRGLRVEPDNFENEIADANGECVNTIAVRLHLEGTQAHRERNEGLMVRDMKNRIIQRRVVFSPNLHAKRPILCDP